MTFSGRRSINTRLRIAFCFVITLVIAGLPTIAMTATNAQEKFQSILLDSLEDIWTGREFSPELKRRQKTLDAMLTSGAVKKAEMETMMETAIFSLLDRHQTTRYILKAFPERVNALFFSHLDWESFRTIMWRALSSAIKKNDPLIIKIGTLAPPGTPWLTVPETTAIPEIERLSDGKVLIKIYGGGVMGEDNDILDKMNADQVDGCGCTALGVLEASPEASVLLLPGLFNNYEEVDYICEKFRKRLDKAFEEKGYILAALIDTGFFYLFSKNGVAGLADVRKQKVATWFGIVETTLFQELGINPTPVTTPELVSALGTDVVTTNLSPAAWVLGMQAYQYSTHYLKPPLLYSPAAVVVSSRMSERFQRQLGVSTTFSYNIQEILVSEFTALEPEWKRQIRIYEEKSLKAFEAKCGMRAMTFSPEDQQALAKTGQAVQQKLRGKVFSESLITDIQKALASYRAQQQH